MPPGANSSFKYKNGFGGCRTHFFIKGCPEKPSAFRGSIIFSDHFGAPHESDRRGFQRILRGASHERDRHGFREYCGCAAWKVSALFLENIAECAARKCGRALFKFGERASAATSRLLRNRRPQKRPCAVRRRFWRHSRFWCRRGTAPTKGRPPYRQYRACRG